MYLSGNVSTFSDDGLLGVLVHFLKDMKDLVFLEEFVDEGA